MALHTWWLFFATVFFLCATPGPNMLHIMTRSVAYGARASVAAMLGCLSAMMIALIASAAGLSALLVASPSVFETLRYVGAAYLIYLGIKSWRADTTPAYIGATSRSHSMSALKLFRGGLVVGLSNPKLLLFTTAFLPQFIDKSSSQLPQFGALIGTFVATEALWYAVYGIGGQSLARYLQKPTLKRAFNRITGSIFTTFGLALLRIRPA